MKRVSLIFLLIFICTMSNAQQNVLLSNNDFLIYTYFENNNLEIVIEDFKDYELNWEGMGYSDAMLVFGKINASWYKKGDIYKTTTGSDGCNIEVDRNQDGKLSMGDKGFFIVKHANNGKAFTYLTGDSYTPMQVNHMFNSSNFKGGNMILSDSEAKVNVFLGSRKQGETPWLVYHFSIPVEEIIDLNNLTAFFRIVLDRTTHYTKPEIEYKTFVFPDGQDAFWDEDDKFFKLDFSNSEEKAIVELKEKTRIAKQKSEQRRTDAIMLRKLFTKENVKKASKTLPKYDGLYIETANGLFLEVPRQKCYYGKLWKEKTDGVLTASKLFKFSKEPLNPYYVEEVFDTLRFIQIEKSNIKSIRVVSGGELKSSVDYLSFHPIQRFPLYPLEGSDNYLYKEPTKSDYYHDGLIKDTYMYWFNNPKLEVIREPGDSWSYKYFPVKPFEENCFYGGWANRFIWVFEVIPDKPKPIQNKTVQQNRTSNTQVKK